jgi:pimeloyl-ACP methyl ester carboxylesterase
MTTTPLLFHNDRLHALWVVPAAPPRAGVVLLSPLLDEKRCAHRALVSGARALAAAGVAVLLPDLTGTGNSAGQLAEATVPRWVDDIHAAMAFVAGRVEAPPILIGCRAGALLAVEALAHGAAPSRLLLLHPVLAGKSYLSQLKMRRKIQTELTGGEAPVLGAHELDGEDLSPTLWDAIAALALPATLPAPPTRLLQCAHAEKLLTEYARLSERWGDGLITRPLICEPFWTPHTPSIYAALAAALVEEVLA